MNFYSINFSMYVLVPASIIIILAIIVEMIKAKKVTKYDVWSLVLAILMFCISWVLSYLYEK